MEETNEPGMNPLYAPLTCEACRCATDARYKDPKSDKWLCYKCDRAFKANVYGSDFFKQAAMFGAIALLAALVR